MEQASGVPPEESLEDSGSLEEGASLEGGNEIIDATADSSSSAKSTPPPAPPKKSFFKRFNVYILILIFIFVIAGVILAIAYFQHKRAETTNVISTQALTQNTLNQLANSDSSVGNNQQVLNVQSSAVFAGKVLVREGLEVAGKLQVGGTIAVANIAVSGTAGFNQAQVGKDLSVGGNSSVQGSASVGKSLQVKEGATFGGPVSAPQITTSSMQLNGDLVINKHIVVGGGTPTRSNGPALGSGGSSSISGSDTAGTVNINVGSSPGAGCFVTVNFTSRFNDTPHVIITPVGSAGGTIDYYVNRTSSNFSICDATTPPAGKSFGFDYFVVD
jgi:cytoskeletal protein CcmA (bactofilin family)